MGGVLRNLVLFFFLLTSFLALTTDAEQDVHRIVRSAPEPIHAKLPWLARYYTLKAGWVHGGPCGSQDYKCLNALSLKYVNQQRRKSGKKLYNYKMGTVKMLENAMKHSKAMKRRGRCYHQNLEKTNLGCSAFFAAENVAQSHVLLNPGGPTDPAKMCSKQLKKSPPHYRNILSDYNKQFVMGVYVDQQGYIWCTQIFTVFAQNRGYKCEKAPRVGDNGNKYKKRRNNKKRSKKKKKPTPSPTPTQSPSPTPSRSPAPKPYQMASTGHKFQRLEYQQDGKKLPLQCGYCLKEGGYCMPEQESIEYDQGKRPHDKKANFYPKKSRGSSGGSDDDWGDGGDDWGDDSGGDDWGDDSGDDWGSDDGGDDWGSDDDGW